MKQHFDRQSLARSMFNRFGDFLQRLQGFQWAITVFVSLGIPGVVKTLFNTVPLEALLFIAAAVFIATLIVLFSAYGAVPASKSLSAPAVFAADQHLSSTIFQMDFTGLWGKTETYIDLIFRVSSTFDAPIWLDGVDGRLSIGGEECSLPPRLLSDPRELSRHGNYECRVRQPIMPNMAAELAMGVSDLNLYSVEGRVRFSFGSMKWLLSKRRDHDRAIIQPRVVCEEAILVRGPVREEDADKIIWRVQPVFVSQVWYNLDTGSLRKSD